MAVALGDFDGAAIDFRHPAAALEHGGIGAEPHGAAEIAVLVALLKFIAAQPFRHQAHQRLRRRAELGGVGLLDADKIARRLDHGHLHAEADTEIRHVALARELDRKSTRLNSSHMSISYAVFCLKKKKRNSTKLECTNSAKRMPAAAATDCPRSSKTKFEYLGFHPDDYTPRTCSNISSSKSTDRI